MPKFLVVQTGRVMNQSVVEAGSEAEALRAFDVQDSDETIVVENTTVEVVLGDPDAD